MGVEIGLEGGERKGDIVGMLSEVNGGERFGVNMVV